MINFGKIKKTYNGQVVLDIDNFSIEENKTYVITGSNGSGKSTLAKIIANLIPDDNNIVKSLNLENKYLIGYLAQKPYVFDMNLEKNILINNNDKNKCESLIKKFSLEHLRGKSAKKFSGGEQQKMSLARFMMKDYDIVILDEPTSAMDENSKKTAVDIIEEYTKNKTMIMITHDLPCVEHIADYIIKMDDGKIYDRISRSR